MGTWKSICRAMGAIALLGCLILLADCAGRRGGSRSGESESKRSESEQGEGITLPGQDRHLPSEDPRNQPGQARQTRVSTSGRRVYEPPAEVMPDNPFPAPPIPAGGRRYRVQVLASTFLDNAVRLREELVASFGEEVYLEAERGVWRVQVGDEEQRAIAESLRRRLLGLGYEDAFVVESNSR